MKRSRRSKRKKSHRPYLVIPALLVVAVAFFYLGGELNPREVIVVEEAAPLKLLSPSSEYTASTIVPAVDEAGGGVLTYISVDIIEGTGRTLANIDNIFFFVDTQNSIRTAQKVAKEVTGFDLSQNDLVYTITADASVIEGPSAGAAIAVAIIDATLPDQQAREDVMITGTILPDGRIGKVGKVLEKAFTAKDNGATLFLVPRGTSLPASFTYEREKTCSLVDGVEFCETEYVKKQVNELGIQVEEVGTIEEALKHFGIDVE